jgi:GcrA cell cycle regulator
VRRQAWTKERRKLLQDLWAQGETAAAIGIQLGGLTRSAVLGKVFRLRLAADSPACAAPADERHVDQEPSGGATTNCDSAAPKRRYRHPARAAKPRRPALPVNRSRDTAPPAKKRGKSLLELTNHSCRWPHGRPGNKTFFFCGADEADLERGMPYCPLHAQRAYVGGAGNSNPPSVTWSTLRAVFSPTYERPRQRAATGGSRS